MGSHSGVGGALLPEPGESPCLLETLASWTGTAAAARSTRQGQVEPAIVGTGEIQVRDLEILPGAAGSSQRSLEADEPFLVRLRLDPVGAGTQFSYAVTVVARTVGEPRRQTRRIGEATGTLAAGGDVEVQSTGLPPGIYRLDGAVRVRQPGLDLPHRLVTIQGGLLQVTRRADGSNHGPRRSAG